MRIIAQNVDEAYVKIGGEIYSEIKQGYMILVSFTNGDTKEICDKMAQKLVNLRVFQIAKEKQIYQLKILMDLF